MYVDRKIREELNALSKEIFGVSSKWQKLVDGVYQTVTRDVEEAVPAEFETQKNQDGTETQVQVKAATTRTVKVPVPFLDKNGRDTSNSKGYKAIKRYTLEEIHAQLLDMKTQLDIYKQVQAARIADAAANAKAAKDLQQAEARVRDGQGSAL